MSTNFGKAIIKHYDNLIEAGNDPVYDPFPLQQYMNKWDGQVFIDCLQPLAGKNVLEIGVGTGRLAVKVSPQCENFVGIDISSKTIEKAKQNLCNFNNATLICGDFLSYDFDSKFDIIYSSLTFFHIKEKQKAIEKTSTLLNPNSRIVLSISKDQSNVLDFGDQKLELFPDTPEEIYALLRKSGFKTIDTTGTEFAFIISAII